MTPFDFVMTLLSFIYALSLAHLLSRIGALILARERLRPSGLQALMMLNGAAQVFVSWLFAWDFRGVADWDLASIAIAFLYAVAVYLICAVTAPDVEAGQIDLEAFYWRNRRVFWGLFALFTMMALISNLIALKGSTPALFWQSTLMTLPNFAPCLLGLATTARWAQWTAGLGILGMTVLFLVKFSPVLH